MANLKVSQLNALTFANVSANDLFMIADISATQSKQISALDLQTYVLNNGSITASVDGSSSYALIAQYALNATTSPNSTYATSSLSSSWASASLNTISSSYSLTASYALNTVSSGIPKNSSSASYLQYIGNYNGTASYAIVAGNANYATNANYAINSYHSTFSDTASVAYALANSGVNMSGNYSSSINKIVIAYNTQSSVGNYDTLITKSVYSQGGDIIINSPYLTSNILNISARGLIAILHNNSTPYESDWNPTLKLIVQDLSTGITQSIATASYSSYLSSINTTITTISTPNAVQRYYLSGSANLNGAYNVYIEASFLDDGDNDLSFYPYGTIPATFRLVSNANSLLVNPPIHPTFITNNGNTFNYNASWTLFSATTSSNGIDNALNLVNANSSSYITSLSSSIGSTFNTITGLWTLTSLQNLLLDNTGISSMDGIPPSLISMSAVNCNLTSMPPMNSAIQYTASYINVSNTAQGIGNNIQDISNLPVSMSYLNLAGNINLNSLPPTLPKGIKYLNIASCSLQLGDLDEFTAMLVSEASASNIHGGYLNIDGNYGMANGFYNTISTPPTLTYYNVYLLGHTYGWTTVPNIP